MGSSGGNNAQRQAEQNEAERQRQIAAATGQINSIFDSPDRQAQYEKLGADTTKYYTDQLNDQKEKADRQLKFSLARGGQVGGSLQVDQTKTLGDDYLKGVIEASRRGQSAAADLRSADEQTRMNLIAAAQAGADATTSGSQAASAMRANLESSQAGSTANALGDFFGDFSDIYRKSQDNKALRDQYKNGLSLYSPMYGAGSGYGGY
jgi:hypothetical protein